MGRFTARRVEDVTSTSNDSDDDRASATTTTTTRRKKDDETRARNGANRGWVWGRISWLHLFFLGLLVLPTALSS